MDDKQKALSAVTISVTCLREANNEHADPQHMATCLYQLFTAVNRYNGELENPADAIYVKGDGVLKVGQRFEKVPH